MPVYLSYGVSVEVTQTAWAQSADATYAAWAAALGVSSSATLQALDSDDEGFLTTWAAPALGSSTRGMFSSEGGLGVYQQDPLGTSSMSYSLADVNRMYGLATRPDVLMTWHPPVDCRSEGVRLQRAGAITILAGRIRTYNAQTNIVDFAVRLDGDRNWRIVLAPVGTAVDFKLFSSGGLSSALSVTVAAGAITCFDMVPSLVPWGLPMALISPLRITSAGAAAPYSGPRTAEVLRVRGNYTLNPATQNGRIASTVKRKGSPNQPMRRRVRLYRDRDGLLVRETWSDALTGAYEFRNIETDHTYTVIADDYEHNYRSVLASNLTPEPMP